MPILAKNQAIDRLAKTIAQARTDELVEFHNELYPEAPTTLAEANRDVPRLKNRIVERVQQEDLEVEELIDLWNVVFPKHCNVHYDEDSQAVVYGEGSEPYQYAD